MFLLFLVFVFVIKKIVLLFWVILSTTLVLVQSSKLHKSVPLDLLAVALDFRASFISVADPGHDPLAPLFLDQIHKPKFFGDRLPTPLSHGLDPALHFFALCSYFHGSSRRLGTNSSIGHFRHLQNHSKETKLKRSHSWTNSYLFLDKSLSQVIVMPGRSLNASFS